MTVTELGNGSPPRTRSGRGLGLLLAALAVSQAGDWLYTLALLSLVLDRTHSATAVALTSAARILPMPLVGSFGGVVTDRFDRRRVMVVSDVVRLACMVGLVLVAVVERSPGATAVTAAGLAALSTTAGAAYPPCVAATLPRLVSGDALAAANATRSLIGSVCVVAGPAAGAVLLLVGSPAVAFAVNGSTFAVSAALVMAIRPHGAFAPPVDRPVAGVLGDLRCGLAALRAHPSVWRLLGADAIASGVYGVLTVTLLLTSVAAGLGEAGYGYLLAALGLGGVLAAPLAVRLLRLGRRVAVWALACLALALVAAAAAGSYRAALVMCLLVGAGSIVIEVTADTAIQRDLPPDLLGRAYGLVLPVCCAAMVVGAAVAPVLVRLAGPTGAMALTAVPVCGWVGRQWHGARAPAGGQVFGSPSTPAR
jgi:MFS family permease